MSPRDGVMSLDNYVNLRGEGFQYGHLGRSTPPGITGLLAALRLGKHFAILWQMKEVLVQNRNRKSDRPFIPLTWTEFQNSGGGDKRTPHYRHFHSSGFTLPGQST
jgi:hypothetical protein